MSLAEAVIEIAEEMEGSIGDVQAKEIHSWAKQLRRAVKAAENLIPQGTNSMSAAMQHFTEIENAKKEFRDLKKKSVVEETEGRMAMIVGGPSDGTYFPIVGDVPFGALVPIDDMICRWDGDQLRFCPEKTEEHRRKLRGGDA